VSTLLYFDCFAGASGDMILGALLDAGLPLEALRGALGSLAIEGYTLAADRVLRAGVSATKFRVVESGREPAPGDVRPNQHGHASPSHEHEHEHARAHGHAHAHGHGPHPPHSHSAGPHEHRSLTQIEQLIASSAPSSVGLSPAGRERAIALFRRLAEAEAAIHDMPVDRVHLHEVGALDSIIDIVGAVFALEWFGADRIVCSPINTGSGMVRCAHGTFPVPAPATARLIAGVPVYAAGPSVELLTPTGALITTGYATQFGPLPAMAIEKIGYGAGDRDFAGFPNVVRVFVGSATTAAATTERVMLLECEIDDMNPQIYGVLMDRLLAAGALDVYYAPVQMKKNRPGTLVTIVAPPDLRPVLTQIIFRETTTLGLRYHEVFRECLARERVRVQTPWGAVRIKVARQGDAIMNAAPEFDDCVQLATEHGRAVKEVQAAAMQAFWQQAPT